LFQKDPVASRVNPLDIFTFYACQIRFSNISNVFASSFSNKYFIKLPCRIFFKLLGLLTTQQEITPFPSFLAQGNYLFRLATALPLP
jgi:hypothetical protein